MNESTPYTPPAAHVADASNHQFAELKMFSSKQRIGRLRYLGYSFGVSFLILFVMGIVAGIVSVLITSTMGEALMPVLIAIYGGFYILVIVISVIFSIKRLHDLDQSGWLCILLFIPVVGFFFYLYLLFAPGSSNANRFGNPPPPNSTGIIVTTWIIPVVIIAYIGILAAIAIPAYNAYIQKTQEMQMQR